MKKYQSPKNISTYCLKLDVGGIFLSRKLVKVIHTNAQECNNQFLNQIWNICKKRYKNYILSQVAEL